MDSGKGAKARPYRIRAFHQGEGKFITLEYTPMKLSDADKARLSRLRTSVSARDVLKDLTLKSNAD